MQAGLCEAEPGVLVLILQPAKDGKAKQYLLHYYDLHSGKRKVLGAVPFVAATIAENNTSQPIWAFALSGKDAATGQAITVVGDAEAIPGYLPGATSPAFDGDSLSYASASGEQRKVRTGLLLGTELSDIYVPSRGALAGSRFLQLLPDGSTMIGASDSQVLRGTWQTDGITLTLTTNGAQSILQVDDLATVKGIPAGTKLSIRLTQSLSTHSTHEGKAIKALLIAPIVVNKEILAPAVSIVEGSIVQKNTVGWGFGRETASLTIHWTKLTLPDGRTLAMTARVYEVENAQEQVVKGGKIQGIRSTGTPGHSAENGVLTFAGIDPMAYIFATAGGNAVLGFAEPEIEYPAGTEMLLEDENPVLTTQAYPPAVPASVDSIAEKEQLEAKVKTLPFRTRTKGSKKVSDITNLVFIGSPSALQNAFAAAGWLATDELHAASTFRTLKTVSGNQTYTQAPMSVLTLDDEEPIFGLSKTTNSFASRHHLRVFPTKATIDGKPVLTASSTQDVGIAFSKKQKTFIHVIDEHIDNERGKIVNDLVFTGCVDSLDMVDRPDVPRDASNSTGDRLLTDGKAAVLHINSCDNPRTTKELQPETPSRFERSTRNTALTIRNGIYRGNLIYQGISGGIKVRNYFRSQNQLPTDKGSWRATDASGNDYAGLGATPEMHEQEPDEPHEPPSAQDIALMERAREMHRWDPPHYEFALQGGYMDMRETYLTTVGIFYVSSDPAKPFYGLGLQDIVDDGWAVGGSVTVNSWKHFSNEFGYFRQQIKYELHALDYTATPTGAGTGIDETASVAAVRIGLVTRQFEYNLLMHIRPPTSRWRPYAAVGPSFQLIALNGAPLRKPAGPYALGLKNIGLLKAAFDFGSTPPLEGGGIFQFGLQYGAGLKYRVSPRVMLRADWRETWSKNPDILADSYRAYSPTDLDKTYSVYELRFGQEAKFISDRYTLGVAFTF